MNRRGFYAAKINHKSKKKIQNFDDSEESPKKPQLVKGFLPPEYCEMSFIYPPRLALQSNGRLISVE